MFVQSYTLLCVQAAVSSSDDDDMPLARLPPSAKRAATASVTADGHSPSPAAQQVMTNPRGVAESTSAPYADALTAPDANATAALQPRTAPPVTGTQTPSDAAANRYTAPKPLQFESGVAAKEPHATDKLQSVNQQGHTGLPNAARVVDVALSSQTLSENGHTVGTSNLPRDHELTHTLQASCAQAGVSPSDASPVGMLISDSESGSRGTPPHRAQGTRWSEYAAAQPHSNTPKQPGLALTAQCKNDDDNMPTDLIQPGPVARSPEDALPAHKESMNLVHTAAGNASELLQASTAPPGKRTGLCYSCTTWGQYSSRFCSLAVPSASIVDCTWWTFVCMDSMFTRCTDNHAALMQGLELPYMQVLPASRQAQDSLMIHSKQ